MTEITAAVREVAAAAGARKAILFGSYARGTADDRSDLDVVFVEKTEKRFLDRLDRYMGPLFDRLGIPVEVFVYTPEEYEGMKEGPFMARIEKEGVVAYERREEA